MEMVYAVLRTAVPGRHLFCRFHSVSPLHCEKFRVDAIIDFSNTVAPYVLISVNVSDLLKVQIGNLASRGALFRQRWHELIVRTSCPASVTFAIPTNTTHLSICSQIFQRPTTSLPKRRTKSVSNTRIENLLHRIERCCVLSRWFSKIVDPLSIENKKRSTDFLVLTFAQDRW